MGLHVVGYLVAHARLQHENTTVFQLGVQFTFQAVQHMAFSAPMVSQVPRAVLDHPYTDGSEVLCAPCRETLLAQKMLGYELAPLRRAKGGRFNLHISSLKIRHSALAVPGVGAKNQENLFQKFCKNKALCQLLSIVKGSPERQAENLGN
jgi:hypothetical protein